MLMFSLIAVASAASGVKTKDDSYAAIKESLDKITEATETIKNELEFLESLGYDTKEVEAEVEAVSVPEREPSKVSVQKAYTEQDAIDIAKVLYNECRGVPSKTERACVAWVILNRVDNRGSSIYKVVREKYQFAFSENTPVKDSLLELAYDVLDRWSREKSGESDVGRVIPQDYEYFNGDGVRNRFRNKYSGTYSVWDYSYDSPYDS